MHGKLIHKSDLLKLLDVLRKDFKVMAPFAGKGRDSFFDEVTDANRDSVAIHVANPYYPPKRYVFPHVQKLLKIEAGEKPTIEEINSTEKIAVFGMRSCDVEGVFHLDRFYLGNAYRDVYYEQLRSRLFIVK
jgi:hypothetical protein